MTITDEITIIANQLANAGKKPTVALVKAKLNNPAPMPMIISTLRNWTHDAEFIELTVKPARKVSKENASFITSAEIDNAINQALQPIKAELTEIKALLAEMKNNQG